MISMTRFLILFSLPPLAVGCTSADTCEVTGEVTWQKQPLPDGHIVFLAEDDQTTPAAGKIVNGQFSLRAAPGKKRVEISANREKPGQVNPVMGLREREQFLPLKYNANTTLTAEVKTAGKNHFVFALD